MIEMTLGEFARSVRRMRAAQVEKQRIKYDRNSTMKEYADASQHVGELERIVDGLCDRIADGTANVLF